MIHSNESVWPTFFIVGAARSGTTSLWSHLRTRPEVFLPDMKEPGYFSSSLAPVPARESDRHCPDDLERYRRLFRGADQYAAIGDASPSYLWDADAPSKIHRVCPSARIIIMLRDPVDRAYSHYLLTVQEGNERRPFLRAIQEDYAQREKGWWSTRLYVDLGLYHAPVRRYLEIFGREQVGIFLFNDLKRNAAEFFAKVALHLGVAPEFESGGDLSRAENAFKMPRYPALHGFLRSALSREFRHRVLPKSVSAWFTYNNLLYNTKRPEPDRESRRFLQEIFSPDVILLEKLLNRQLPELRASWI